MVSVDPSQKPQIKRPSRSAFKKSDEEKVLDWCIPLARIKVRLIKGSHWIRNESLFIGRRVRVRVRVMHLIKVIL